MYLEMKIVLFFPWNKNVSLSLARFFLGDGKMSIYFIDYMGWNELLVNNRIV